MAIGDSITFILDQDQDPALSGNLEVQVTITEVDLNDDGVTELQFDLEVVGGTIGDLRGFYFDLADDSLLGSLVFTGDDVTTYGQDIDGDGVYDDQDTDGDDIDDPISNDADPNPLEFEVGVELGSKGITGEDDIRETTFYVSSDLGDLTLADLAFQEVGVRAQSVGDDREGSSKLIGSVPVEISGNKFEDSDGDGVKDAGEGVPTVGPDGAIVYFEFGLYLRDAEGGLTPVETTTMDSTGEWSFLIYEAPDESEIYVVKEVGYYTGLDAEGHPDPDTFVRIGSDDSDWVQTYPTDVDGQAIDLSQLNGYDFGNFKLIDISGIKFEDTDGDGIKDEGEGAPLTTFRMGLFIVNGDVVTDTGRTSDTDSEGNWSFEGLAGLPDGQSYQVKELGYFDGDTFVPIANSDWVQTTDDPEAVDPTSGVDDTDGVIGNFKLIDISGYKWHDDDRDGVWDEDEIALDAWTIELLEDGIVIETTTTATIDLNDNGVIDEGEVGYFEFSDLGPGNYTVREVIEDGWVQTHPGEGIYSVGAESGQDQENLNFGNDIIDGPGFRTPGFWKSNLGQTFWNGVDGDAKTGDEFALDDLLYSVDSNGDGVVNILDEFGLLLGDWNGNGVTDEGENTRFYTLDEALDALEGDTGPGRKDAFAILERDAVAAWLNELAGNPFGTVDGDGELEDAADVLDQAIQWLNKTEADRPIWTKSEAWQDGVDLNDDGILDLAAGSYLHETLDDVNNYGDMNGVDIGMDGDNWNEAHNQYYLSQVNIADF